MQLVLRRANVSRKGRPGEHEDYDVFDGDREVGRVYRLVDRPDSVWFWGLSYQLTGRKSSSRAGLLKDAKAAFRGGTRAWKGTRKHVSRLSHSSHKPGR
jgi:hypothetical protein